MQGDIDHVTPLTIDDVSRIHFRGGSHLGIARANPTTRPARCSIARSARCCGSASTQLITIGGDDTAFSAMQRRAPGRAARIRVVHVPEDHRQRPRPAGAHRHLRLPDGAPLRRRDRQEPDGRREDHLALVLRRRDGPQGRPPRARHRQGGRRDADAHPRGVRRRPIRLKTVVDTLAGAIIKRLSYGRRDGVAVIAEGLVLSDRPGRPGGLRRRSSATRTATSASARSTSATSSRRRCGSGCASSASRRRSSPRTSATSCAAPTRFPFDMEYTRDLGYCAAELPARRAAARRWSRSRAAASCRSRSTTMIDPETGRTRVRSVDVHVDALRDRAALHDPAAPRRLRGSARPGQARGDRAPQRRRVPQQFAYVTEVGAAVTDAGAATRL